MFSSSPLPLRCSGLIRGNDVACVGVDAVLAVQAEGGDLDLEGGPVGSLEFQVSPLNDN